MSAVHFTIQFGGLFGERFKKWLVTSTDTDQCIFVPLAMSSECVTPQSSDALQVVVKRIVNVGPRYILVNRAYNAIEKLRDNSESAWPPDGQCPWRTMYYENGTIHPNPTVGRMRLPTS